MKIRSGFVSNSSSSSFIVALPKCPESVDELREMFFGKLSPDREIYASWDTDYQYGHKIQDIANQMFKDLKRRNPKSMTQEEIAEMMEGLYYWTNGYNCFSMTDSGGIRNNHGWSFRGDSRFFGADEELLHQLQLLYEEEEVMDKSHQYEEQKYIRDILQSRGISRETLSEQDYYDLFQDVQEDVYKNDIKFQNLRSKNLKESHDHYQKLSKKRHEVAMKDAKWMMDCYYHYFFVHFEYGDNHGDDVPTGMGSVLETGHEIWARVRTTKINHH